MGGLKPRYEEFHEVSYTDEALEACVNFADQYITDRFLPDKAIDLLDETGARKKVRASNNEEMSTQQNELETIQKNKQKAVDEKNYLKAASLKKEEEALMAKMKA